MIPVFYADFQWEGRVGRGYFAVKQYIFYLSFAKIVKKIIRDIIRFRC